MATLLRRNATRTSTKFCLLDIRVHFPFLEVYEFEELAFSRNHQAMYTNPKVHADSQLWDYYQKLDRLPYTKKRPFLE